MIPTLSFIPDKVIDLEDNKVIDFEEVRTNSRYELRGKRIKELRDQEKSSSGSRSLEVKDIPLSPSNNSLILDLGLLIPREILDLPSYQSVGNS